MKLCRYVDDHQIAIGFHLEENRVIPLQSLAKRKNHTLPEIDSLLPFLPDGQYFKQTQELFSCLKEDEAGLQEELTLEADQLLVPVQKPEKLMLLAGNYSKHIEEGGGIAEERDQTFPYVFMKPPSTTLTHPGNPIRIPKVSPFQIDWEIELAVIIGKQCRHISESDALDYVAGYSIINDISDRGCHPNYPNRKERPKDPFFDWLLGKWHDTFCPMGPAILSASELDDPQTLSLQLKVNGEIEQQGSTSEMVFPVNAIISFISHFITLEPGDIISTGTPAGVGSAKGKYLQMGDVVEATISEIGTLRNPVMLEEKA